ncbi:hypothetical protein [Streptomyces carpinensis]|nr:hypothetical protein [Streptomyces carpinensis]
MRGFNGLDRILEHAVSTDYSLVRAARGDRHGSLVLHRAARSASP